jgi:predicted RecA/RadA family phage recombinase
MAFDIPGFNRSYEAVADLTSKQYTFVKRSGAGIAAAAAATDKVIGVLLNKPITGEAGTVAIDGVAKVKAAKALASGVPVYIDASGRVTDTAASNQCVGTTETACSGADTIVSVLLKPLAAVV